MTESRKITKKKWWEKNRKREINSVKSRKKKVQWKLEMSWFDMWYLLRSAVGTTHSLWSDLWWTIPFHALLDHFGIPIGSLTIKSTLARHTVVRLYSEIDQTYLSIEAQCVSHYYPRWTATVPFVALVPQGHRFGTLFSLSDGYSPEIKTKSKRCN